MIQYANCNFPIAYCHLIFGVVSVLILCSLIPILRMYCLNDNGKMDTNFESKEFQTAGVSLLIASCTLTMDVLLDYFGDKNANKHIWFGRACYAVTSIMVGLQFAWHYDYFQIFGSYESSFWFTLWCYRIVQISVTMFFVSLSDSSTSTFRKTLLITVWGCINTLLQIFDNFLNYEPMISFSNISSILWMITSFTLFARNIFKLWKTRLTWSVLDYTQFVYVGLFLSTVVLGGLVYFSFMLLKYISDHTNFVLLPMGYRENSQIAELIPIYLFVVTTMILTVIPGRIARQDAITSKDHIISTKQAYVRYISHEMRTPMNTVHMGIQFCIDQIPENTINEKEIEYRKSLLEVNNACEVALEILNDLLLYDKLQNGQLTLHKEEVNALDFVTNCLSMFTVQIKAKHLQIQLINCDNDLNSLNSIQNLQIQELVNQDKSSMMTFKRFSTKQTNLFQPCDTYQCIEKNYKLFVDNSKLGQVIRNIMSNAIKFTPAKGAIQVSIKFVSGSKSIKEDKPVSELTEEKPQQYLVAKLKYFFTSRNYTINKYDPVNGSSTGSQKITLLTNSLSHDSDESDIEEGDSALTYSDINEHTKNGMLVIEVKDSGAGISFENQQLLFKEVVQFNPEKLQAGGGSGLGLWITKEIVDMHGGHISVYSEGEGHGSTFRLEIPMSISSSTH